MTKDWGAVHDEIRALSFVQKKPLEEIRELMERKYKFRASTRAYRMKLKEWGLQRHKPRRSLTQRPVAKDIDNSSDDQDSSETVEPALRRAFHQPANWDGITVPDTVDESRLVDLPRQTAAPHFSNVLNQESPLEVPEFMLNMLSAVLENDAQKLETMIIDNVGHINDAVGLPFGHAGRFFDYPLIETMKILQHPGQRLLDIACGMPCGPVVWVLLSYGATGSENPPGTDLALYNAIKNNRPYTIQALLTPGRSKVNGLPGATWKPLMQAVLQNVPEAVRILLSRGANVDEPCPSLNGNDTQSVLHLCLQHREKNYHNANFRSRCHQVLKLLIHAAKSIVQDRATGASLQSAFHKFIEPWQTSEYWAAQLDKDELECLRLFIAKGADLLIAYHGFPCETTTSKTFQHQAVWHSTPKLAELIIDSIPPESGEGCSRILHELLGSCPHVRDHPADTLRNVKEILHKGIDTKLFDMNGITPLERCMERSPDTHLVTLLRLLMEHGADPEDRDGNGTACYIRVARVFKESNLADEVMQAMIPYFRSRHAAHEWTEGMFPIPEDPTCEQVFASIRPDTDILLCIQNNIPHDVRSVFQRAYLAVLSTRFLDNITRTPRLRALDNEEKNEIIRILSIRKEANIATYTFSQELVINILAGQNSVDPTKASQDAASNVSSISPTGNSSPSHTHTLFQFNPNNSTPLESPVTTNQSPTQSYPWLNDDFVPSTTQVRWQDPCSGVQPGDLQKASEAVLIYRCLTCNNGTLLTKKEHGKHDEEHRHTRACTDAQCLRRFCAEKKRIASAARCHDHMFPIR